jgi:hypothetical protein
MNLPRHAAGNVKMLIVEILGILVNRFYDNP